MDKTNLETKSKIIAALVILTFGTIGIVTHFIPLSSAVIVFYRAFFGAILVYLYMLIKGQKVNIKSIKDNLPVLILTGFYMGLNWVFSFKSYKIASVSVATVCYNTMPIFVVMISPLMFEDKLTRKGMFCIFLAAIGILFVSNVLNAKVSSEQLLGVVYGLLAAIFYALVVLYNKKLKHITTNDKILFQFIFSAIIMFIYVMLIEKSSFVFGNGVSFNDKRIGLLMLILLVVVHTAVCYISYFEAILYIKPETIAILTYLDPMCAIVLSFFILGERMTFLQVIGAALILVSTLINEFGFVNRKK